VPPDEARPAVGYAAGRSRLCPTAGRRGGIRDCRPRAATTHYLMMLTRSPNSVLLAVMTRGFAWKVRLTTLSSFINFTNVANDAQVARTTVYEYFETLKDTLILHELPAWRKSRKRKPLGASKYYFFDVGVVAALQGREFRPGTPEFGEAFETTLFHELMGYRDYVSGDPLGYWRSTSGFEVDFVIGDHTAVEAKAKENVSPQDLRSLVALGEEGRMRSLVCVSLEPRRRRAGEITILPWRAFLDALWGGEFEA